MSATNWYEVSFGSDENALNLTVVVITELCEYTKNDLIV